MPPFAEHPPQHYFASATRLSGDAYLALRRPREMRKQPTTKIPNNPRPRRALTFMVPCSLQPRI